MKRYQQWRIDEYVIVDVFYVIRPYQIPPPSLYSKIFAMPNTARSVQTHKSISFIWIVWSTLYVYFWSWSEIWDLDEVPLQIPLSRNRLIGQCFDYIWRVLAFSCQFCLVSGVFLCVSGFAIIPVLYTVGL